MISRSGGLKPRAVAGRPSVTRLTQSSCTGIRASGIPRAAVRKMQTTCQNLPRDFFCTAKCLNRALLLLLSQGCSKHSHRASHALFSCLFMRRLCMCFAVFLSRVSMPMNAKRYCFTNSVCLSNAGTICLNEWTYGHTFDILVGASF